MSPTRFPAIVIVGYITLFSAFLAFSALTDVDVSADAKTMWHAAASATAMIGVVLRDDSLDSVWLEKATTR